MKILITELLESSALRRLEAQFDVHYDPTLVDTPERIVDLIQDADGLIVRNRTQVRGPMLEAASALKAVGRLGVGLDNLDLDVLEARKIPYFPATGANSLSVAEYVITTAMILLRPAYHSTDRVRAGEFPKTQLMGLEAAAKTLGLIGFGAIAQLVAKKAAALDFKVCAHDPFLAADHVAWQMADRCERDEVLRAADVVSLHLPLTPDTEDSVDATFIAKMKTGAVLINTARGEIIDEAALINALKSGRLGGAALDVFREEPLGREMASKFDGLDTLILTPHIAGNTQESNKRVSVMVAEAVAEALGRPLDLQL